MVSPPLISVIIPVYNGEKVVTQAISSILTQSYQNIELLVIDDCSTDNTKQVICSSFSDDRIRLIEHVHNLGAAQARNTGLENAAGEIIAFLDADDISVKTRLEAQISYLDAHPHVGAVGSSVALFGDDAGNIDLLCSPDEIAASTMFTCEFLMPTMTFRKSAFDAAGCLFRPEYFSNCDWELIARMVRVTDMANLPERLVHYRRWSQQMTSHIVDTLGCPATLLRSEMLEWFGIPRHEQDLAAHITAAPCYWPLEIDIASKVSQERIMEWLDRIRKQNHATRKFSDSALDKILRRIIAKYQTKKATENCGLAIESSDAALVLTSPWQPGL